VVAAATLEAPAGAQVSDEQAVAYVRQATVAVLRWPQSRSRFAALLRDTAAQAPAALSGAAARLRMVAAELESLPAEAVGMDLYHALAGPAPSAAASTAANETLSALGMHVALCIDDLDFLSSDTLQVAVFTGCAGRGLGALAAAPG